jgi:hypothetical protein
MINRILQQHYKLDTIQLKDKLIQNGGGNSYIEYMNLIIGIIIIILGLLIFNSNMYWKTTTGVITNIKNENNYLNILISYDIDNQNFNKYIKILNNYSYKIDDIIKINYDINNPNIIKLHKFNYEYIGIIIIIIGIFVIIKQ